MMRVHVCDDPEVNACWEALLKWKSDALEAEVPGPPPAELFEALDRAISAAGLERKTGRPGGRPV